MCGRRIVNVFQNVIAAAGEAIYAVIPTVPEPPGLWSRFISTLVSSVTAFAIAAATCPEPPADRKEQSLSMHGQETHPALPLSLG